jgi:hypothetical protein
MKTDHWQKLTQLARQAPSEAPSEVPFGMTDRVLAAWRRRQPPEIDLLAVMMPWVRGALAASVAIAALTFMLTYISLPSTGIDSYAVAKAASYPALIP